MPLQATLLSTLPGWLFTMTHTPGVHPAAGTKQVQPTHEDASWMEGPLDAKLGTSGIQVSTTQTSATGSGCQKINKRWQARQTSLWPQELALEWETVSKQTNAVNNFQLL